VPERNLFSGGTAHQKWLGGGKNTNLKQTKAQSLKTGEREGEDGWDGEAMKKGETATSKVQKSKEIKGRGKPILTRL